MKKLKKSIFWIAIILLVALLTVIPQINTAYSSICGCDCYCVVEGFENDCRYIGGNCSLCYSGDGIPCTGTIFVLE